MNNTAKNCHTKEMLSENTAIFRQIGNFMVTKHQLILLPEQKIAKLQLNDFYFNNNPRKTAEKQQMRVFF